MREQLEQYYHQLRIRRSVIKNQMGQPEFAHLKDFCSGEISAINQILAELREGFGIKDPDHEG